MAQLPREVVGSPYLEVSRRCGHVALRDVVGWAGLGGMVPEVFSNLNDSVVGWRLQAGDEAGG